MTGRAQPDDGAGPVLLVFSSIGVILALIGFIGIAGNHWPQGWLTVAGVLLFSLAFAPRSARHKDMS